MAATARTAEDAAAVALDANGDELTAAVACEALIVVANARELHAELFGAYPEAVAKKVSRLEREAKELPNRSLVYGEIPFQTVEEIFQLMRSQFGVLLDKGGNFYDLGSGCGKVVRVRSIPCISLTAPSYLCLTLERLVFILDGLHGIALKVLDHWRYKMLDGLPAAKADVDVGFAKADATNVAIWKDATLVFCNSTCFSDSYSSVWVVPAQLIQSLSAAADELSDGSYFVTITKPLASKHWKTMLEQKFPMSWGKATVIVQKKVF